MLKYLLRGFSRRPADPPPRPRAALPPPDVPVVALARAPLPAASIAQDDYELSRETNDAIEADLEEAFAMLRARQHINDAQRRIADGEFLVAMGVVEKFAYQCLDFGPERTHHVSVASLTKAFEKWAQSTGRYDVRPAAFVRSMVSVLEWQGGHRSTIEGSDLFVGCKLTANFTESLTKPPQRFGTKERVAMGLKDLYGGRLSSG